MEKIKNTALVFSAVARDLTSNMADKHFRREIYMTTVGTTLYGGIACLGTVALVSVLRSESEIGLVRPILGTFVPVLASLAAYTRFRMGFDYLKKNYKDTNLRHMKLRQAMRIGKY